MKHMYTDLDCQAAYDGSSPTFRDSVSVSTSRVKWTKHRDGSLKIRIKYNTFDYKRGFSERRISSRNHFSANPIFCYLNIKVDLSKATNLSTAPKTYKPCSQNLL